MQILIWDGVHVADGRVCATLAVSLGSHRIYVVGFEHIQDSQLEVTYSGPDTYGVRTHIGGKPFIDACNPATPLNEINSFNLCTFKSEPTTNFLGDCTPTVGNAHPRYAGPCMKALNTTQANYDWYAGYWYVPVLGSAGDQWVRHNLSDLQNIPQLEISPDN